MSLEGLKEAQEAFNKALKEIDEYTARALVDVVLDLTGKAVELAPVETGDLRGSGVGIVNGTEVARGQENGSISVSRPNFKMRNLEGEVSFSTPYAVRQHEDLTFNHPQGGQAKYLEEPFKKNKEKYIKWFGESVAKLEKRRGKT